MAAAQCFPSSPAGTCLSSLPLSTTPPLTPLYSDCTLITPLFILGLSLLIISLALSHCVGPVDELGQLGPRGRRNYTWNERKYGAGGRFIDWWLFGGSVYIRALLFLWDWCFAGSVQEGDDGGENVFACFGVANRQKGGGEKDNVKKNEHKNMFMWGLLAMILAWELMVLFCRGFAHLSSSWVGAQSVRF